MSNNKSTRGGTAKSPKYQQLNYSDSSIQGGLGGDHTMDYNELAKEAALLEDDYDITTKRIDWNKITYASQTDIQRIQILEGFGDELLAPDTEIRGVFLDPTDSIGTAKSFIKILQTSIPEQLAYILTLLSHILQQDNRRGESFLLLNEQNLIQTFSRIWGRDDISSYTAGKAAICAAIILSQAYNYEMNLNKQNQNGNNNNNESKTIDNNDISLNINRKSRFDKEYRLLRDWMLREFKKKNDKLLPALYALKGLIANIDFQSLFCSERGVERLFIILTNNIAHRQVVYLVVYCLWALSFNDEYCNHDGLLNGQLISLLVKLIPETKSKNKKIARVILQMFENLLNKSNFNEMVVLFELHPILEEMEDEKTDDPEMKQSISKLFAGLGHSVKILSSHERYLQELRSDKLSWGPTHNEAFWKKYSHLFEEDNYKMIQMLINLLKSPDAETLAVACYDLGEWSRFYSDAKRVIEKFGGKQLMMELIQHEDANVRKYALSGVQKLLIKNWQNLDSANVN